MLLCDTNCTILNSTTAYKRVSVQYHAINSKQYNDLTYKLLNNAITNCTVQYNESKAMDDIKQ